MIKKLLKKFDEKNLFIFICKKFNLNKRIPLNNEEEFSFYYELYQKSIIEKIKILIQQCEYILIEDEYTEFAWKEIFSLHYAHTSYCNKNKVMRIHFFNNTIGRTTLLNNEILSNSYLGYITLRPVPDFNLMLSFVLPNWTNLKYIEKSYIMTYDHNVHIMPYTIPIKTFAFYCQDTIVTTCAQADIIMLSTYTSNKYNHKMIKITDIMNYMRYSPIPSKGLKAVEILEIFRSNGIPVEFLLKKKIKKRGVTKRQLHTEEVNYIEALKHCTNILDSYIESGLPVIVYNAKHVVLVIGHTNTYNKEYIIYDDSGAFLNTVTNNNSFVGTVTNKLLFPNSNDTTYLICATHNRVYLSADDYDSFVDGAIENSEIDIKSIKNKRSMIVDNAKLKNHLLKLLETVQIDPEQEKKVKELIFIDLPHYLWYTEIELFNNSTLLLIGDATYPINTSLDIFKFFCFVPSDFKLELLTKI